jgi:hypothetical protein
MLLFLEGQTTVFMTLWKYGYISKFRSIYIYADSLIAPIPIRKQYLNPHSNAYLTFHLAVSS